MLKVFIVWNSLSFLHFLCVAHDHREYYVVIDRSYNSKDISGIQDLINKAVDNNLIKGELNFNNIYSFKIHTLIVSTIYSMTNLYQLDYNNLILLQDGTGDYINDKPLAYLRKAIGYFSHPEDIPNKDYYKEVRQLKYYKSQVNTFVNLLPPLNLDSNPDLILVTSPLNTDYRFIGYEKAVKRYLEENYSGKNILIKSHPRDILKYKSNSYTATFIDRVYPAELLLVKYKHVPVLFVHPSTTLLTQTYDKDNVSVLKFKCLLSDNTYKAILDSFVDKPLNFIEI